MGHDQPDVVARDLIDVTLPVSQIIRGQDLLERPDDFKKPGTEKIIRDILFMSMLTGTLDAPVAVEVPGIGSGYRLGTGVKVMTGAAAGRQLYAMYEGGDIFSCDGRAEANIQRLRGVEPGDMVHVSNKAFLAFCYYYRHHVMDDPQFDFLRPAGRYIYPQHPVPLQSPLMGVSYSGQYEGKLLWVHHTHDASLWPPQGLVYKTAVEQAQGPEGARERFRLRWTQNAEHITPMVLPSGPDRAVTTWLIDYMPAIEQSLWDLIGWVEDGVDPAATTFDYVDGEVILPADAATRKGIQPVVAVSANGATRAEVNAGETVTLTVSAEVPPGAGRITRLEWDFDGTGTYPSDEKLDGTSTTLTASVTHTYATAGTFYATARVWSHRDGDPDAVFCQIANLASARIVVA